MKEAIVRIDWPSARPREISSRSERLNAKRERRRVEGLNPPVDFRTLWIEPRSFPNARAISFIDCPLFHRSQSSCYCGAESPGLLLIVICTTSWAMS